MVGREEKFCSYVEEYYEGVGPPHFHRSILPGAVASAGWYKAIYPELWNKFLAREIKDRMIT